MTGYRGLDTEEGWIQRRFAALEKQLAEQSSARRLVVASDFVLIDTFQTNNFQLPDGVYDTVLSATLTVPDGYTSALIQASGIAQTALSGGSGSTTSNGSVGAQVFGNGNGTEFRLPSVVNGRLGGGNLSVAAPGVTKRPMGPTLTIALKATKNTTGTVAGYDYAALSAVVLYTRSA